MNILTKTQREFLELMLRDDVVVNFRYSAGNRDHGRYSFDVSGVDDYVVNMSMFNTLKNKRIIAEDIVRQYVDGSRDGRLFITNFGFEILELDGYHED